MFLTFWKCLWELKYRQIQQIRKSGKCLQISILWKKEMFFFCKVLYLVIYWLLNVVNIDHCWWYWTLHERWGVKTWTLALETECFGLHWCVISRLLNENSVLTEPSDLSNVKRHSEGTFSNDYSKYLETRRAQDFVQWLKNSKRNG